VSDFLDVKQLVEDVDVEDVVLAALQISRVPTSAPISAQIEQLVLRRHRYVRHVLVLQL